MPKKKYTITEAAKYLGVSRQSVHLAIKRGKLRATMGTITIDALLIDGSDLKSYQVDLTRQRAGKKTDLA
jgi:predicted DNA-binding protein (UPF0251 family)